MVRQTGAKGKGMWKKLTADRSQCVMVALCLLILCAELVYFALQMRAHPKLLILLFGLFAVGIVAVLVIFSLLKLSILKPETVFLICLLVLGICYIVVIGPLKSNDETSHYVGAYWLSNLMLGIDPSSIQMRGDDLAFYEKWAMVTLAHKDQFYQLQDGFSFTAANPDLLTLSESTSKNPLNSPIQMYLFPSIGLTLGRLVGLGAVPCYYLGRLLALGAFSAIAYVSVRNTPLGKPVFMAVALLPMTVELCSSFSYDGPTIALALLLTSFCFKALYVQKQATSTLVVIAIASILLVPLKVVYSTIILLVLVIPGSSFQSKRFALLYKTLLLCVCLLTFMLTRMGTAISIAESGTSSYSVRGSYESYSLNDLLQDPLWAAHVFLNSFFERMDFKTFTYLGANMGQNNLSPWASNTVSVGFLLILLTAFTAKDAAERPNLKVVLLCILCFALTTFAVELTMFIGNAERGSNVIIGTLGRYFIPVTPLLVPLFVNTRLSRNYPTPKAILFSALCLNIFYIIDIYGYIVLAQ